MLTTIRSKASSIVSYVLIGLLCLSFALFGIQNYLGEPSDVTVATVGDQDIKKSAYENQVNSVTNLYTQQYGRDVAQLITANNEFRAGVLNDMMNNILLGEMISDFNYSASDKDLADYIVSQATFQNENGEFDQALYERVLSQNGVNVQSYEEGQRASVAINQIEQSNRFMNDYTPTKIEEALIRELNQERDIDFMTLPFSSHTVEVSEQEVENYYNTNKENYLSPKRIKLDYVVMTREDIKKNISVTDEEVQNYYENNKSRYVKGEERTARHILVNASDDEASQAEALQKALDIKQRIANGEDFAELARTLSDDSGSATRGGDLGVVNRGVMVEPFENALLSLPLNEVSEPVKTQFGYHLIEVTNITPERGQAFDEVATQIKAQLIEEMTLVEFEDNVERMKNLSFENPDLLDPIAEDLDLTIQTTDFLEENSNDGIFQYEEIKAIALSDDFISDELNSDAIVTSDSVYVIRKNQYEAPEIQALDTIKDTIFEQVEANKKRESLMILSQEIVDQLQSGKTWNDVLAQHNAESTKAPIKKSLASTDVEVAVVEEAFSHAVKEAPVYGHTYANDDLIIYQINSVNVPESIEDINAEDRESAMNLVREFKSRQSFEQFFETLRMNNNISINESEINIF